MQSSSLVYTCNYLNRLFVYFIIRSEHLYGSMMIDASKCSIIRYILYIVYGHHASWRQIRHQSSRAAVSGAIFVCSVSFPSSNFQPRARVLCDCFGVRRFQPTVRSSLSVSRVNNPSFVCGFVDRGKYGTTVVGNISIFSIQCLSDIGT